MRTQKFSSNKEAIVLCLSVKNIVFVNVLLLLGNLTFIVVTVLAIFNTLSTLNLILLDLSILSNSLYSRPLKSQFILSLYENKVEN